MGKSQAFVTLLVLIWFFVYEHFMQRELVFNETYSEFKYSQLSREISTILAQTDLRYILISRSKFINFDCKQLVERATTTQFGGNAKCHSKWHV